MAQVSYGKPSSNHHFLRVFAYTFILLMVQVHWVSRLPAQALRIDLLVPLMFAVSLLWPPLAGLFWAFFWGFVLDVLSGKFWGFHVGTYVITCCLVTVTMDRLEMANPFFHLLFIGLISLGQSLVLGFFLWFEGGETVLLQEIWWSLLGRSAVMTLSAIFIVHPLWKLSARGT